MPETDIVSIAALIVVFALCAATLGFQLLTGVPPVSSNAREAADVVALLKTAGLTDTAVVYELGSGWGSLVIALARAFPDAEIRGIEISPLPYWISRWRTRKLPNVRLRRGDFLKCDLSDAQAVTCFLMTGTMPRIAERLDRTLRPGTPVVSVCFWFRDRTATASLKSAGLLGAAALYLWPGR